jgi:hypothetical protein
VALYITERKGGKLVVGHNLSLLPPRLERETQAAGLDGFWAGRHLQHALEGMEGSQRLSPPPFMKTCKTPC